VTSKNISVTAKTAKFVDTNSGLCINDGQAFAVKGDFSHKTKKSSGDFFRHILLLLGGHQEFKIDNLRGRRHFTSLGMRLILLREVYFPPQEGCRNRLA
jgi:hypothetical protein